MQYNKKFEYYGRDLADMSFAKNYYKWILDEFNPYLGNKIAEVGAGIGNFSKLLVTDNTKYLVAFEPAINMYPLLKKRLAEITKVETVNRYFSEEYLKYENSFDSVVYVNVLEHIENDQQEISYAQKALKDGGHLLLFVPALSWLYSNVDKKLGHLRRYKKRNLIKLIRNRGFTIVKAKYFDLVGILPWYITFILLKKSLSSDKVSLYDRLIVPIMRKFESVIKPPIGKNLLLIARKN